VAALAALREREWVEVSVDAKGTLDFYCSTCHQAEDSGHAPTCPDAAILALARAAGEGG
jgi:hypothetical protein